jgi:hypothetical protein
VLISIVTAFYNRKPQFLNTLKTLSASSIKDFELIIVDDGSDEAHRLDDVIPSLPFPTQLIRLSRLDRWYCNPCVPFNIGIKKASGDILFLQNPECLHCGDLLKDACGSLHPNEYRAYSCYGLSHSQTEKLSSFLPERLEPGFGGQILSVIGLLRPCNVQEVGYEESWYNHPQFRPKAFHFAACMYRSAMLNLGGFDLRYAGGLCYDDDELVHRIRKKGMKVNIPLSPMVFHQAHPEFYLSHSDAGKGMQTNENLLHNVTFKERSWTVNGLS